MTCARCGYEVRPFDRFCRKCGAPLEVTVRTLPHPIRVVPAARGTHTTRPSLSILNGRVAGSIYALDQAITRVGRDPANDVFLDDVTVSRRHAEIRRHEDGTFAIVDLDSLNGTYVNGLRTVGVTALADGARVQIGRYVALFYGPVR
jgi:pSer/pThr/pTyr-binding forkhead associated (FHA) protein